MDMTCGFLCDNKTEYGYCRTTGCINPKFAQKTFCVNETQAFYGEKIDNLIDREVLFREMEKLYNKRALESAMTGDRACHVTWNDAVYLVKVAPTIEAEPVKHGRWTNVKISISGDSSAECSLCGAVVHNNFSSVINYCPNCGARMDGGTE